MTSNIGAEQGPYTAKRPAVPKQKWTPEEEVALRGGVSKYGTGKWRLIQKDDTFGPVLANRSNVDLKDKWRNLTMDSFSMRSEKPKPGKRGAHAGTGQGEENGKDGVRGDGPAEVEEPCPKRRRRRKKKPERAADATDYPHVPAAALQALQDALSHAPGPNTGTAHQPANVQPKLEAYTMAAPLGAAWLYGQPGAAAGGAAALLRPVGQHPELVEPAERGGGHGAGVEPGVLAMSLGGPGAEALRVLDAAQAGSLLRGHGALGGGFLARGLPLPQPVAFPQHSAAESEPADGCALGTAAKRRRMRKPARPAELHGIVKPGEGEQESGEWPEDEEDKAEGDSTGGRGHPWSRRRRERAAERCERHGPIPDDMVVAALISLQDPIGSQLDDIHLWIEENYGAGAASRKMVKRTLARMVEAGRLDAAPGAVRAYRLGGVMCRMSQEAVFGWRARCHEDDQTAAQAAKAAAAAVAEAEEAAALATQLMAVAARVEKEAQAQAAAAARGQLPAL